MKILGSIVVVLLAMCLSGFTDADISEAQRWIFKTKAEFANCLRQEVNKALELKMSPSDFATYVKGTCIKEAQSFRVPAVDLLAMKSPDLPTATYLQQVDLVIQQWRDDATKAYIEIFYQARK